MNVVGIPLLKGNSHEVLSAKVPADRIDEFFEGQAVSLQRGGIEPKLRTLAEDPDNFYGFIFDINRDTGFCSLLRKTELSCLPTADSSAFTEGDEVRVSTTSGLIDVAGDRIIDGMVVASGATTSSEQVTTKGVNGRTGEEIPNCIFVQLGGGRASVPPAV